MNAEFLQSLGINDEDPNVVLSKLGAKEIELLDKKDLAETNGADERVKEIENLLEQLKKEREVVKEDAKNYVPKKEETSSPKEATKAQSEKKSAAYDKLMAKKKAEAQAAQEEVLTSATKSNQTQNTQTVNNASNGAQSGATASTPSQTKNTSGNASSNQSTRATGSTQTTSASPKQNKGGNTPVATQPTASGTGEFSTGLRYYQKQDFANAFKCFMNVAENKSASDATAVQERTQASYLLAVMYRNGAGTNVDVDRSNHYLKRAADFGYDQAQLEYGELVLSQHMSSTDADIKARKVGWKYIEKAADAGLVDAIKKYIDLAKTSADTDKHIISKAKAYIPSIKGQLDSYEAQKCDDWVKELNATEKAAKKKASYPKKYVIGEILFLLGTIYLFKGLNPIFFEEIIPKVNKFIPNIPELLIIKWPKLVAMTDPYMTHQGIFGGWLIVLGNLIRGLGVEKATAYKSKLKSFGTVIKVAIIALCVIHFIANIIETEHFFGNGSYMQILAMVACIIIGRILGWIVYKIIK